MRLTDHRVEHVWICSDERRHGVDDIFNPFPRVDEAEGREDAMAGQPHRPLGRIQGRWRSGAGAGRHAVGDVVDLGECPVVQSVAFRPLPQRPARPRVPVDASTKIDEHVHINHTRQHVARAPRYDPDLVQDRQYQGGLYGYYGYGPFWGSGYMYPGFPYYW
jgi:hypothetical protein